MTKAIGIAFLLVLTGCAGYPVSFTTISDCSGGRQSTFSCQVEVYNKAGM